MFYCFLSIDIPIALLKKCVLVEIKLYALGPYNLVFSSEDGWIKKMWRIYTMEYYSAIKRNEIELFVVRGMDLETVIQSEVS